MFVNIQSLYIWIVITLSSIFLVGCKYNLQPIEVDVFSGDAISIDLKRSVKEYPTDAPVYFYIKSEPKHGKLSREFPQAVYTSDKGYVGNDTFKIFATYKGKKSNPVSIKITVKPNLSKDRDKDRVKNDSDAFPDDPSEIYDTDKNGTGNYKQNDEDGDGINDQDDAYPFDTATRILGWCILGLIGLSCYFRYIHFWNGKDYNRHN